jgi:hypothetical protein
MLVREGFRWEIASRDREAMRKLSFGIAIIVSAGAASAADQPFICYYNGGADFTVVEKAPPSAKIGEVGSAGYSGDKVYSYVVSARDDTACPNQVPLGAKTALTVALVRHDSANCTNDDVSAAEPAVLGGSVTIYRVSSRASGANFHVVGGVPETTYAVFLKCGEKLGTLKTDAAGRADRTFNFPLAGSGSAVAFELTPEGSSGVKLQSIKVAK